MRESLIEAAAKLRELEAKASCAPWRYVPSGTSKCGNEYPDCVACIDGGLFYDVGDGTDTRLTIETRNNLLALLDILSEIREGDAKRLAGILRWRVTNEICNQEEIDMLDRLHTMCCKMEARK